jgi:hypothetical protein
MTTKISITQLTAPAANITQSLTIQAQADTIHIGFTHPAQ